MKLYIINGANLNLLGIREPHIYGQTGYADLVSGLYRYCEKEGIDAVIYQSNHEGDLIDKIQEAYFASADGIVLNPGAYTHTSIGLFDALAAVRIPTVEVHISDVTKREEFRQRSYIRPACVASVVGHGIEGYYEAIDILKKGREKSEHACHDTKE